MRNYLENNHRKFFFFLLRIRTFLSLVNRKRHLNSYLKKANEPKLHIGAGRVALKDWLNTDYIAKPPTFHYLNVTNNFPFENDCFQYIFSEHLIEHINYEQGVAMLKECHRILKPGGIIRIETPDLKIVTNIYNKKNDTETQNYIKWHHDNYKSTNSIENECFAINNNMRNWGHQFVYDEETLKHAFNLAGFKNITRVNVNKSKHKTLANLSGRDDISINQYETLAIEAEK